MMREHCMHIAQSESAFFFKNILSKSFDVHDDVLPISIFLARVSTLHIYDSPSCLDLQSLTTRLPIQLSMLITLSIVHQRRLPSVPAALRAV